MDLLCLFVSCVSHTFAYVNCCLVVTCFWLLLVMCIVFVTFPCGFLDLVWYLIVSISDLCPLSYFSWEIFDRRVNGLPFNHSNRFVVDSRYNTNAKYWKYV